MERNLSPSYPDAAVPKERHPVSWPLAIALAVAAVVAAAAMLAVVPNLLVSRLGGSREVRVAVATVYQVVAFVAVAWGAMRLQRRGMS